MSNHVIQLNVRESSTLRGVVAISSDGDGQLEVYRNIFSAMPLSIAEKRELSNQLRYLADYIEIESLPEAVCEDLDSVMRSMIGD